MAQTVDAKIRALVAALTENPRDLDTRIKLAKLYAKASRTDLAITEYLHISNVYAAQSSIADSIQFLERVLDLRSDHAFAHRSLIFRFSQSHRIEEAVERLRSYLRKFVQPLAANGETGEALARLRALGDLRPGGPQIAILALRELTALDPHDLDAARTLADLLVFEEPKEAIAFAQRCLRANPDDLNALRSLAKAFEKLGEKAKARAGYEQLAAAAERAGSRPMLEIARDGLRVLS